MEKIRFYTTDSNNYWKQCKYCGAFCQLVIDGKPTNRTMNHYGDCAVFAYENLLSLQRVNPEVIITTVSK